MRVNSEHHETATACVADFFSKLTQGQIDPGALTAALFNKAIIEMMRMDGADAVHKALRVPTSLTTAKPMMAPMITAAVWPRVCSPPAITQNW